MGWQIEYSICYFYIFLQVIGTIYKDLGKMKGSDLMALLKINRVSKVYGENKVLDEVSLSIEEGEIHGLLGENGAGKSTLMNILFGMPVIGETGGFEGDIYIDGNPYKPSRPTDAMEAGIGMVHQEFMLIPGFSVTENVKLNRENTKSGLSKKLLGSNKLSKLDTKEMAKDTNLALEKLDLKIDQLLEVEHLPVGYKQFIEIAREIDKTNLKLLILDEPTAVLTESEAADFLDIIKSLSRLGIAVLFITHRLNEIKDTTDNITIIRDGKMVKSAKTSDISIEDMAKLMVGRDVSTSRLRKKNPNISDEIILELDSFSVNMPGEQVKSIDLKVKRGEILGIGGLAGQGKVGIANGVMGLYPTTGKIYKDGERIKVNSPRASLERSIAFLSEDRKGVGLLLDDPIDLNIAYTSLEIKGDFLKQVGPFKLVDKKELRSHTKLMIEDLDIRCTGPSQNTRYLSGGNQQKVCIARALTLRPDLLLVSEPTRGIDIGAKNLVLETLIRLNEEYNTTIIITSSELAELKQIADRVAIVTEGKITSILSPDDSDAKYGLAMSGNLSKEVI